MSDLRFTDKKRDQLKEIISHNIHLQISVSCIDLEALLARLEVAEEVCKSAEGLMEVVPRELFIGEHSRALVKGVEAWREILGK